jgi:hypothetical protein
MKYLFLCLFLICNFYSNFAQAYDPDSIWIEDPLCKPEIWQKLIAEPTNNELWTLYVGKNETMMSYKELSNLWLWKQVLMLRGLENITPCKDYSISEEEFLEIMQQIEKAKKDKLNIKPKIKNKTKLK